MAGDRQLTAFRDWLERRTAGAPAALRQRLVEHVDSAPDESVTGPRLLAHAAAGALARVVAHVGDRSVALDLLSADGLITLALLRQSEDDPDGLAAFARSLTEPAVPP